MVDEELHALFAIPAQRAVHSGIHDDSRRAPGLVTEHSKSRLRPGAVKDG
jgi:hypothetical protein